MSKHEPLWPPALIQATWLRTGRGMRLGAPVDFTCSKGLRWHAPEGAVIDGASIPRFLWRVIGSPYCGRYRAASVIHDVYCVSKARPSKEAHRAFYEMMLASGMGRCSALVLWLAVRCFGPRFKGNT